MERIDRRSASDSARCFHVCTPRRYAYGGGNDLRRDRRRARDRGYHDILPRFAVYRVRAHAFAPFRDSERDVRRDAYRQPRCGQMGAYDPCARLVYRALHFRAHKSGIYPDAWQRVFLLPFDDTQYFRADTRLFDAAQPRAFLRNGKGCLLCGGGVPDTVRRGKRRFGIFPRAFRQMTVRRQSNN